MGHTLWGRQSLHPLLLCRLSFIRRQQFNIASASFGRSLISNTVMCFAGKSPFNWYPPAAVNPWYLIATGHTSVSLLALNDPFSWSIQTVSRRRLIAASSMSLGHGWWRCKAPGRDKGWGHSDTERCRTEEMSAKSQYKAEDLKNWHNRGREGCNIKLKLPSAPLFAAFTVVFWEI